jgi:hypothetical protein
MSGANWQHPLRSQKLVGPWRFMNPVIKGPYFDQVLVEQIGNIYVVDTVNRCGCA